MFNHNKTNPCVKIGCVYKARLYLCWYSLCSIDISLNPDSLYGRILQHFPWCTTIARWGDRSSWETSEKVWSIEEREGTWGTSTTFLNWNFQFSSHQNQYLYCWHVEFSKGEEGLWSPLILTQYICTKGLSPGNLWRMLYLKKILFTYCFFPLYFFHFQTVYYFYFIQFNLLFFSFGHCLLYAQAP